MTFDGNRTAIVIVAVLCVTGLLALAMWLGVDLSWVPGLLKGLIGNGSQ